MVEAVEVVDGVGETGERGAAGSSSIGTASSCIEVVEGELVVAVVVVVVVGISSSLVGRHRVSNDSSCPSEFTEYVRDLLSIGEQVRLVSSFGYVIK